MYEVLDYHNSKWADLVKIYDLDVYFAPQYCKIWENYGDGKNQAFLYKGSAGKVLYPYLIRKIDFGNISKIFYDITTPYGYGGPVLLECEKNNIASLVKEFRSKFDDYAFQKGIISEFVRFHPIYQNNKYFINSDIECEFKRNTIQINLLNDSKNILMNMKPETRNKVRQAQRNNLDIQFYSRPSLEDIKRFAQLYLSAMQRLVAPEYYKFPLNYFKNCFKLLVDNSEIAFVLFEEKVISSAIFLFSENIVHYHLSGSLSEYNSYRPNNLMLYQAALRYKEMGKKTFHLGGGYKGNDSLFKFKKGFNKNDILDFYVGKKIHQREIYNNLVEEWKNKNGLDDNFKSDYFPLYRCKL